MQSHAPAAFGKLNQHERLSLSRLAAGRCLRGLPRSCGLPFSAPECLYRGSEQAVRKQDAAKDVELLQMVRTLDEMDTVINVLSERVADWYQIRTPPSPSRTAGRRRTCWSSPSANGTGSAGGGALGKVAMEITSLADTRTSLAKVVSARACEVMPNTSALIGGLVAARLLSHAGGLQELARLPASAIQVLGARNCALCTHQDPCPRPQARIIFQHRRVHNAPREVRGKVARVLAGKLAIAARLDFYRGCAVPAFLEDAQARIDRAGTVPGEGQP